jgi:DNA-binding NarL/FixJ family response regulator
MESINDLPQLMVMTLVRPSPPTGPDASRSRSGAPATPADSDRGSAGVLRQRETDVARLVADGLSNKEIGGRLFISERTVESHVRSIMNKLGFNSRAQIAGWIATSDR